MASQPPIDVTFLADRPDQAAFADIFDRALNGPASEPVEETAETAAAALDDLYSSRPAADAESTLWNLWTAWIDVARRVPASDSDGDRQELLVSILAKLKSRHRGAVKIWGDDVAVWDDLPLLGACMREAWNFTPSFDGTDQDRAAVSSWVNLNAFAARLVGASLVSWDSFALWALRDALETEPAKSAARDPQLAVACEWLTSAAGVLRARCADGPGDLDDAARRMLRPGSLFAGEPGLSAQRWQFWTERLETLGKEAGSADLRARVDKAVATIKSLDG